MLSYLFKEPPFSWPSQLGLTHKKTSATTLERAQIELTAGEPLAMGVSEEQTSRNQKSREGCVTNDGQEKLPSTA